MTRVTVELDTLRWLCEDALGWNRSLAEAQDDDPAGPDPELGRRIAECKRLLRRHGPAPSALRDAVDVGDRAGSTAIRDLTLSDHFHYPGDPVCNPPKGTAADAHT
jgi:hypothetical protein